MGKKAIEKKKKLISLSLLFLLLIIASFIFYNLYIKEYHTHADFKVYLNDNFINFSQDKYQSTQSNILHEFVHLHDLNGEVIHHHERGISLKEFFNSLSMNYSKDCFSDDLNNSYCTNQTHELNTYVNGKKIDNNPHYIFNDLDQILISFTSRNYNQTYLLNQVTNKACIESAKCPERGEPSEGSCVTGSSCGVDINSLLENG